MSVVTQIIEPTINVQHAHRWLWQCFVSYSMEIQLEGGGGENVGMTFVLVSHPYPFCILFKRGSRICEREILYICVCLCVCVCVCVQNLKATPTFNVLTCFYVQLAHVHACFT